MKKRSGVRSKILKVFAASLLLVMVLSLNAFASGAYGTTYVPEGSSFVKASSGITRSTAYSYVTVQVSRVYPADNSTDNYTKCRARLCQNNSAYNISNVYTCTEGGSKTYMYIYEGELNRTVFDLWFAGNNPDYDAYIAYSCLGN